MTAQRRLFTFPGRVAFAIPLLIFLATAGVGVWAAYDRSAAWAKFWLLAGAVLLFFVLAAQPRRALWTVATVLGAGGVLLGTYWLLVHDWSAQPAKFGFLNRMLVRWMDARPGIPGPDLQPNVAGGTVALLFPFLVAVGIRAWRQQKRDHLALVTAGGGFALLVVVISTSRGAWLALAVAMGIWLLWALSGKLTAFTHLSRRRTFALALLFPAGVLLGAALFTPGGPVALLSRLPGPASAPSRLALDRRTLALIGDFPFTGGGLDAFPGLYSQYVLVIPFYFLPNGHNIFLDAALEQGVLGALALAGIFLGTFWLLRPRPGGPSTPDDLSLLRWATIAGLLVLILHGLVEDTVYGTGGALLLFLFPGLALALHRHTGAPERERVRLHQALSGTLVLVLVVGIAWGTLSQRGRAAWLANLGAVEMARVELAGWPTGEWSDGSEVAQLAPAGALFQRALAADPRNRTAHQRLGRIARLERNFGTAIAHLEAARQVDETHRGIRKALGYNYVWAAQPEKALPLLATIPEAQSELDAYRWWWQDQGYTNLSARAARMASRLNATNQVR